MPSITSSASFVAIVFAIAAVSNLASVEGQEISFTEQIQPIFRDHCQGCHQPAKAQGDYVMTDFGRLVAAGESGDPAVVLGKPDESYLIAQITPVDGHAAMPKKGPALHATEIELIRKWIEQGAKNDLPASKPAFGPENLPKYQRLPVTTSLAFSPDGKWLATTGFNEVILMDAATFKTKQRLVGISERIESLCFSPDSQRLAVSGGSPGRFGEVQVWDVAKGALLLSHQVTYDTVYGGSFSPDGKLIAFGCSDNTVRAIDSETGEQRLHQGAHDDWIRACVFNPSGTHVLSAGRDMTVKLTEVATERFIDNVTSITPGALRGGVNTLAMHPERDEVLVGGADGVPKVYRIFRETQRRIGDDANLIRQFPATGGRIFDVDISPDGKYFALVSTLNGQSKVQVYPYDFEGKLPEEIKAIMMKRVADRKPEEKKKVDEYLKQTSEALVSLDVANTGLYAVAFSPDATQVVCGGTDGQIRVLNIESGKLEDSIHPVELEADEQEQLESGESELLASSGMPLPSESVPVVDDERGLLPNLKLAKLSIHPESVTLTSDLESVQLVVLAEYEDGVSTDVTRLCTFEVDEPLAVNQYGLLRLGAMNGKASSGDVRVQFGDQSHALPVEVAPAAYTVDFIRDVNPVLSRLGCNSGTCHGAQKGKNGFKLSLRGYDPLEDIRSLSDDLGARRLNIAAPDSSLMLLKPLGTVPHEGGVLLKQNSVHYRVLREWIAAGAQLDTSSSKVARIEIAPQSPVIEREGAWQQFRVVAHYPDGSQRDVTQDAFIESGNSEVCVSHEGGRVQALRRGEAPLLVRYEGAYAATTVTVMGNREGFVWEAPETINTIDRLVASKWQRMKIQPSGLTSDNEFLRRLRLDLTGLPPTAEEVRGFQADVRPSRIKRQAKIEELIGSEEFIEHWTNKWADLLQVNSKFLGREGATSFRGWIREAIQTNQPYDQFAWDILTASGSNKSNPAASYYKILREPDLMMENTTHLFLAIRFNCNKCHDHPFERWTQDQYYELAAYFAQTGLKRDPESGDKKIGGTAVEGAKPLYEEVFDKSQGEMSHVRTGNPVAPAFPYAVEHHRPEDASRRQELAAWITSAENPYFARSFVNRLWGYLTGTGLIEPLDDIRAGNPPTNPELLDHLTEEFTESGFDVQHILRLICNSRTYQLSVRSQKWNEDDAINYSHAKARRLPAEVLYDAVHHVTGAVSSIPGVAPGTRAAALPDVAVQLPDGFLNNLGRPVRESACECERSEDLQLGPVMALVSGPTIGNAISDPKCDLPTLAGNEMSDAELIREVYMRILSREPSEQEIAAILTNAEQIAVDHQQMQEQLAAREAWWQEEYARLEAKRAEELEATKKQIVARQEAIQPEREKMEAERQKKIAAAQKALEDYKAEVEKLSQTFLTETAAGPNWFPLIPELATATNKDQLSVQEDRSIVATGKAAKGVYTLRFRTPLTGIRGLRLEALPMPELKGGGPGLPPNGNFVVTEIEVRASDAGAENAAKELKAVAIGNGLADFSQDGFDPKQTFDGNSRDQRGWAVSPRGGTVHWATYEFKEPIEAQHGTLLEIKLHQFHNAEQHRLARFRISVTTDEGELQLGLPEAFTAMKTHPKSLSETESKSLFAYLEKSDKKWQDLKAGVATASKALPEDAELVGLRSRQKLLEVETPLDRRLAQMRADLDESTKQLKNRRLTLAQDLTWALINSPAFLFNH